jgi:toxin ParE1/3/4
VLLINWTASAREDLLAILGFIAEHNGHAAQSLFESIALDLQHAAEHPYLFKPSIRAPGLREIVVHPNYIVFYRVTSECIEVVTVVHARQQYPR